jgi:hypothetical protein
MMKKILLIGLAIFCVSLSHAQHVLSGKITDNASGETLIGASINLGQGRGTISDFDGNYSINLANGKYTVTFSFVGYETFTRNIEIRGESLVLNIQLESALQLDEVNVISNIARARETPVAFSTIEPKKLEEIIAAQDIPMVLNTTPGVYATTEGGGDGDAQVTIRGFSARNVGVLLDGVPVNDMENGHVYWSNWFGLDAVTRSIQVQRGLGASRLALPSVGGTINIITRGFDSRKETSILKKWAPVVLPVPASVYRPVCLAKAGQLPQLAPTNKETAGLIKLGPKVSFIILKLIKDWAATPYQLRPMVHRKAIASVRTCCQFSITIQTWPGSWAYPKAISKSYCPRYQVQPALGLPCAQCREP